MDDILDFVDKIYCINLDNRRDRWESAIQQFSEIGILDYVLRVPAIVHRDPRVGCRDSHMLCIKDAIENDFKNILILEDDVQFLPYKTDTLTEIIRFLSKDTYWDLCYLGGNVVYPARFVNRHVFKARFFSTHAYIINHRFFNNALEAEVPIDMWYAWNCVSYGMYPLMASQTETYSDIRNKHFDNLERMFQRKYDLLVKPNIIMRWVNYINTHYLVKLRN